MRILKKAIQRDYTKEEKKIESDRERKYTKEIELQITLARIEEIRQNSVDLINKNIKRMQRAPNRPKEMEYYDERAEFFVKRVEEIQQLKNSGKKVIGTLCTFAPSELIRATDAIPIRICSGFYEVVQPANDLLADATLCPLVKSTLGMKIAKLSPYFELCDIVISPVTCDGRMKLGEILEDYLPVWKINVPKVKDSEQAKKFWYTEIKELKERLERFTNIKISKGKLKKSIVLSQRAQNIFRRLYNLRKAEKTPIWGRDALLVSQTQFYDDLNSWVASTEKLCNELERRVKNRIGVCDATTPRIMLAGSPIIWPNWKLLNIIEEGGGIIVCDELCSSTRNFYDPIVVDEWTLKGMLLALADRYLLPCTCPCFTPNDERIDRILEMIKDFKVGGIVYHTLQGCHLHNLEFTRIKQALRETNIPILKIESGYDEGDVGQIKTRVEAFLEMITF
ncbi:MAG: double-cubane-cluster-containing anaerobic reductase [Candidatus Thermoplasmatota archaeon]